MPFCLVKCVTETSSDVCITFYNKKAPGKGAFVRILYGAG